MRPSRYRFALILAALTFVIGVGDVAAADVWVRVQSKNFLLIGNASEKDIRRVGTRLEQFRETFRLLFGNLKVNAPIPTNVVVFKNDAAYKPFKPKRADGKLDTEIAGYFQPGEDVNYITLSVDGPDRETYGTIFHEYVHFIIETNFGKTEVPSWFNEGLAEYYQTFEIADDIRVKLGLPQSGHLDLLQRSSLIPLDQLLAVTSYQLHQTGGHSRNIFYAESWALIHYLIQSGKSESLDKFLKLLVAGTEPETAFQNAFQTSYAKMESDLRRYITANRYNYHEFTFKQKLTFDTQMTAQPLGEAAVNAYLGDLLYHTNRPDDAEPFLAAAIKIEPTQSTANLALGMVKFRQRKFDESRTYLETAIAADPQNHNAYYRYAFLLSRDGRDDFGYVKRFDAETAAKMRTALRKAIAINPEFVESYELLAFVALVNNDELDDALLQIQTALKYQPGNPQCMLRLAEIYARQSKFTEAREIAEKAQRTTDSPEIRTRATDVLGQIESIKRYEELKAAEKKRSEASIAVSRNGSPKTPRRIEDVPRPSDAEIEKQQAEERMRSLNEALRPIADGEKRVLGHITRIDCKKRPLAFTLKTTDGTITVTSKDFQSLTLNTLDAKAANVQIGCDANISDLNAMITYKQSTGAKAPTAGQLVAIEFVPADFRLMNADEIANATLVVYNEADTGQVILNGTPDEAPKLQALESKRREAMLQAIRDALKKPADGEKQAMGYLDKIECTNKSMIFNLRTDSGPVRLLNSTPQSLEVRIFPPDLSGLQFRCGSPPVEYPAVFIYREKADSKTNTIGEIVSLEFVPKPFKLVP